MKNNKNIDNKKQLQSQEYQNQEEKDQKKHTESIESKNNILLNIASAVNDSNVETKKLNNILSGFIIEMKKSLDKSKGDE